MTSEQFKQIFDAQLAECVSEMGVKNADYASPEDGDFLKNFYETAERTGSTPLQAWAVHFLKHIIAIERYVRKGGLRSEPIRGRIKDGINYLFLLRGIVEELEHSDSPQSPDARIRPGE